MRSRGYAAAVLLVLGPGLAGGLTGCSSASETSPPTGVDELVVPTPSPDPADFVAELDNPWFAAEDVTGSDEVAGVPVSLVGDDAYAQDRDGNVWWFGTTGEWTAGVEGAQAGLAMPASPRVGDGFRMALAPGVVEDVATVVEVDDDTVVLEVGSLLDGGPPERRTFERAD